MTSSVVARLALPLGGGVSLSALGGPWFGLLVTCGTDADETTGCDTVFSPDAYRGTDYGWDVGAGVGIELGSWLAQIDLRRSQGMPRLLEDRSVDNPRTRTTQLTLAVGYGNGGG